jgi:hypothetical protein
MEWVVQVSVSGGDGVGAGWGLSEMPLTFQMCVSTDLVAFRSFCVHNFGWELGGGGIWGKGQESLDWAGKFRAGGWWREIFGRRSYFRVLLCKINTI